MHHGSCLCGNVTYRITADLSDFVYCHCSSCRKSSGTAFSANAGVDRAAFDLSDPNGFLRLFESSAGKMRAFCSHCGSPIFAYLTRTPNALRIRLGTLDSEFSGSARGHAFVAEMASWHEIGDELTRFDTWPSREALGHKPTDSA